MTATGREHPSSDGLPVLGGRRVVLLEPHHQGHRMAYCSAVLHALRAAGLPTVLATGSATAASEEFALHLGDLRDELEMLDIGPAPDVRGTGFERRLLRTVAEIQGHGPDTDVLLLEGDKFVPATLTSRGAGVDWSRLRVLMMRAPRLRTAFGPLARDAAKAAGMATMLWRGASVRVLVPATPPAPRYRSGPWAGAPDPVVVADPADRRLPDDLAEIRAEPQRRWVGVFGHLSRRKNLDLVLDAATLAGARDVGVAVGGKVMAEEAQRCAPAIARFTGAGGRLVLADRLLTDPELDAAIDAVDVLVLAHSAEGPSGILGRAAALGTVVVGAGARSLRSDIGRLGAGTWVELSAPAIASALRSVTVPGTPRPMAGAAEFARALLAP